MTTESNSWPLHQALPLSPDLDYLKRQAKALKKAYDEAQSEAVALLQYQRDQQTDTIKLSEAQHALAKSYGFASWNRLRAFVQAQRLDTTEKVDLLLKTLMLGNDALLQTLYEQRADLAEVSLYAAAALADVEAVRSFLQASPDAAKTQGGPGNAQALVYASHAPFYRWDDDFAGRQQQTVKLLLDHGGDPNALATVTDHPQTDEELKLSALYGCCKRPGNPELAEVLLQAGAKVSDGESLYHASELPDHRCLALLLEYGPDDEDRDYCIGRCLDLDHPAALELYLKHGANPDKLLWALFRHRSMECIRLLVEYGAELNGEDTGESFRHRVTGLTAIQIAERSGRPDVVDYLLSKNAVDRRDLKDRLIGACVQADRAKAEQILAEQPDIIKTFNRHDHSNVAEAARTGNIEAVKLMLDIGFDIEAQADDLNTTAFVYAATNADVAMTRLLIERGADLNAVHSYGGAALDSAIYCYVHFRNEKGDYPGVVRLLLDSGMKPTKGELQFALKHELQDIAEMLIEHGVQL